MTPYFLKNIYLIFPDFKIFLDLFLLNTVNPVFLIIRGFYQKKPLFKQEKRFPNN